MESGNHSMQQLFSQLGLESDDVAISRFIETHKIAPNLALADAPYWSQSQSSFLRESLTENADWCEVIDQLDSLLR